MHVLLVINSLSPGTGPFQRIIKFNKSVTVSVASLFDSQADLEGIATQFGVDVSHVNLVGLGSNTKFNALVGLYKSVRKIKPDIIQSVHTYTDIVCVVIKYLTKIPVISFEGTLISRWTFLKKYLVIFVHSLMDAVVCVSNNTNKENSNINYILNKVTNRRTIYNGVDINLIDSLARNTHSENRPITIGYTGDLKSVKNLTVLFHAFSKCYKYNNNIRLLIVGSGPEYKSLRNLAFELGIDVQFTGQISRLEVFKNLNLFDIFVMPSLVEGLSESIVQAMASKVPVIVSNINPNKELVVHNRTGLLFQSGDSDSLEYEILRIINKEVDIKFMVDNARVFIEKNLDINDITNKYIELYKEYIR